MDGDSEKDNAEQNQEDANSEIKLMQTIPEVPTKENSNTAKPTDNTGRPNVDSITLFTGVIAICNILVVICTIFLVFYTQRQIADNRDANEIDSRAYLNAPRVYFELGGEALLKTTPDKMIGMDPITGKKSWVGGFNKASIQSTCIIKNDGKTPAYKTQIILLEKLFDTLPEINTLNFDSLSKLPPGIVIGANQEEQVGLGRVEIDGKEFAAIMEKKKRIFIIGEAIYLDIFKRSHYTHFCFAFNPKTNAFEHCGYYNDAD